MTAGSGKPTALLAEFAAGLEFEDLPGEVRERAGRCVLDWLGCALAGAAEPLGRTVRGMAVEAGGRAEAAVICGGAQVPCAAAAWANGVAGHIVELDDIHAEAIIHPGAAVVPAALAAAGRQGASGRALLTAVVAGYETAARIGMAAGPAHYRFWHTTGTCGTFGAAAAAGRLLGLDAGGMQHALGIAGTHAAGLVAVFGTDGKPLNAGRAARDGVTAALLAAAGATGPAGILEADRGYLRAAAGDFDAAALAERFEILRNVFKVHASCGHTHAPLDAVLGLAAEHRLQAVDVAAVRVGTYRIAVETAGGGAAPRTPAEARFNLPYCVAVALLRGRAGLAEFSPEALGDPAIAALAGRVSVESVPEFAGVRLGAARVTIRTAGGRELCRRVDAPRGYPGNPLAGEELEDKFAGLAARSIPAERAGRIAALVRELEDLGSIAALAELLAAAPGGG